MGYVIKNTSGFSILLSYPNAKARFDLTPNRQVSISEAVFEEMKYDAGTEDLLRYGVIQFITEDGQKKTLEELLNPTPNTENVSEIEDKTDGKIVLSKEEVIKLLQEGTIAQFTKTVKNASAATLETIGQMAIELSVADGARTELIKKYCGIDVLQALNYKRNLMA